ncbi:caspase family protein [Streptomyces fuscichromogenes]|uniref:caspase family protein n=1 Tax=Streptomyces fuscichromogenes TaxID=1324013 RepID=UPI00227C1F28|nr:caspase family protein [Streptomyces fuscichromogenes]
MLVGVADYAVLPDLPSVTNNISRLAKVLGDPDLWGLRNPEQCTVLLNPSSPEAVLDAVHDAASEAQDAFVVYFAGHGLVSASGELHLALPTAHAERLYRAVAYEGVRQQLVDTCTATRKVVILDCCYSGRALVGHMGPAVDVANHALVEGTYLITASAETKLAWAPQGETYTAFTGELLKALEFGVPGASDPLEMEALFWHVRRELEAKSRPLPQQRARNAGHVIALVRNRAKTASTRGPDGHEPSHQLDSPLPKLMGGAHGAPPSSEGLMDGGAETVVIGKGPPPLPVDPGPLVIDLPGRRSGNRSRGRHRGTLPVRAPDDGSTSGRRQLPGESPDPGVGRWRRWSWLTATVLLAAAPLGARYLDAAGQHAHGLSQGRSTHSATTPTPSPSSSSGYVHVQQPEFSTAVPAGWKQHAKNASGQYRYTQGAYTLTVVPGRDLATAGSKDPMAYQREVEPELQPYRETSWSTAEGLSTATVGKRIEAVGRFTWQAEDGKDVFAKNMALLIDGRYHIVLTTGPERKEVARVQDAAAFAYRPGTN